MSEILNWEEVKGHILTPGGDPMYICPVCKDKNSRHVNGIEMPRHLDKCPVCEVIANFKYSYARRKLSGDILEMGSIPIRSTIGDNNMRKMSKIEIQYLVIAAVLFILFTISAVMDSKSIIEFICKYIANVSSAILGAIFGTFISNNINRNDSDEESSFLLKTKNKIDSLKDNRELTPAQIKILDAIKADAKKIPEIDGVFLSQAAKKDEQLSVYITLTVASSEIPVSVTEFCLKYRNPLAYVSIDEAGPDFPQSIRLN